MNIAKAFSNSRLCKALTGLSKEEFENLLPTFQQAWIESMHQKPNRIRKPGGGKKGKLPTLEEKLFFILLYMKVYPTYDVLGFLTDRERTRCCRSVQSFLPILETALGRKLVLPERKITSPEEFFRLFPGVKDVFIDGTERRVEKPKNIKKRNKLYSGKKKATTRKTVVINDAKKRILIVTPTHSGRRHDKKIMDKHGIAHSLPPGVTAWTDTGFLGMQKIHPNTIMPKKASKHHPLTPEEKQNNRIISGLRIVSEHAIGGMKRFKVASDTYRNKLANLDDTFLLLSAGLWNFHLQQTQ
jgi:hypothetical protein